MSDGDWKYELEDLEDDGETAVEDLTPGSPKPEHIAFVVLGALLALFALSRLVL
ncbi:MULTISPECIES: hypothetical protein [unclassified Haladaptatus]|uniref:DUF7312 domain-containing protein n=1 Tax=unclassified Haladaptatus TaxID=2622732 RepID=UPI0023E8DFE7|nr:MULTISPECIES: hypothetical protein [unclassified Haladaptatus]